MIRHLALWSVMIITFYLPSLPTSQAQTASRIEAFEDVEYFVVSPDNQYIAVNRSYKIIDIISLSSFEIVYTIKPAISTINIHFEWSADSQSLLLYYDDLVDVWSLADRKSTAQFQHDVQHPLTDDEQKFTTIASLSLDNRLLATLSPYDRVVLLWDFTQKEVIFKLDDSSLEDHLLYYAEFSPNGRWLAVGTLGDTVTVWNTQTGELILNTHADSFAFSTDENLFAAAWGRLTSQIRLWDLQNYQTVLVSHVPLVVSQLEFSTDNTILWADSRDSILVSSGWYQNHGIRGWELTSYAEIYFFPTTNSIPVELNANEMMIHVSLDDPPQSLIWNTETDILYTSLVDVDTSLLDLTPPRFGNFLVTDEMLIIGNLEGEFYITDLQGTVVDSVKIADNPLSRIDYFHDDDFYIMALSGTVLEIYRFERG